MLQALYREGPYVGQDSIEYGTGLPLAHNELIYAQIASQIDCQVSSPPGQVKPTRQTARIGQIAQAL